jgi:hypothetical protein
MLDFFISQIIYFGVADTKNRLSTDTKNIFLVMTVSNKPRYKIMVLINKNILSNVWQTKVTIKKSVAQTNFF